MHSTVAASAGGSGDTGSEVGVEMASVTVSAGGGGGGGSSSSSASASTAAPHRTKVFFRIGGMTCAACSGTIEKALRGTRGVHSAKIALLTERCEVVFDENVIKEKDIIGEIEDVGFEARLAAQHTAHKPAGSTGAR